MNLPDAPSDLRIAPAETPAETRACFPVMRELRPHLASADAFVAQVERQRLEGYRILAVWRGDVALALGGYRIQENLVHGRHLYVDDLVSLSSERGLGLGSRLFTALTEEARRLKCAKLMLDAALPNGLGHRFYFRQGMLATAFRFALELG